MPLEIYVPITFLTWRGRVHAIVYLCSNDFLTWRGRVHANNGMDKSTPGQKSNWNINKQWGGRVHAIGNLCSNYFFNLAWTCPCHCIFVFE